MGKENYTPEEAHQYYGESLIYSEVWCDLHACPIIGHNPALCCMKAPLLNQQDVPKNLSQLKKENSTIYHTLCKTLH